MWSVGHLELVMILLKVLTKKFVKDSVSKSQNFHVNFHKFHALLSTRLSQARLSQVLHKMGSENALVCPQNADNGFGFDFLERCHKDGDEFLNHIVTDDEILFSFVNAETKEESKQWTHTHSPNKSKKFKQTLSTRKLMTTVFWDREGALMVEFMQQGTTITSELYCKTLKKLLRATQKKRCGMLAYGVVLLHDYAHPHSAPGTRALLEHFNWELFDHPVYSPELAPSDYHLFTYLKN
jgi:hypothetical protein